MKVQTSHFSKAKEGIHILPLEGHALANGLEEVYLNYAPPFFFCGRIFLFVAGV